MKAIPVVGLMKLHVTPLALVVCESPKVIVEVDSELEERIRLIFEPFQAMRMITADCFEFPPEMTIPPQTIVEMKDSIWIGSLTSALERVDFSADFMKKARHFLVPLQDDFLEIIAWNVRAEPVRQ